MASFGEHQRRRRRWRFPRYSTNGVTVPSFGFRMASGEEKENRRPQQPNRTAGDASRRHGLDRIVMSKTNLSDERSFDSIGLDGNKQTAIHNRTQSLLDQECSITESEQEQQQDIPDGHGGFESSIETETNPLHPVSSGGKGRHPSTPTPNRIHSVEDHSFQENRNKLPLSDILRSFRENISHFLGSAYLMSSKESIHSSIIDGSMVTSLADDVFCLVHAQLAILDDYLAEEHLTHTDTGDAIVTDAWLSLFRAIGCQQIRFGRTPLFLGDEDSCIARANDYWILGEKSERLLQTAWNPPNTAAIEQSLPEWEVATTLVETEGIRLIDRMNRDAVEAAKRIAVSIIETIRTLDIPRELFGGHWERDLTNNEVATYICRVYARKLAELQRCLVADYLYHTVVITLARCTICFYLQRFLAKAGRVRAVRALGGSSREGVFQSPSKALLRMTDDLQVFRDFFQSLCEGTVSKILANDFSSFSGLFLECAGCAVGQNGLDDFVPVVHKRTGADADVTRHFLSDLWVLMSGGGENPPQDAVTECLQTMQTTLDVIRDSLIDRRTTTEDSVESNAANPAHFAIDRMLKELYAERILYEKLHLCGSLCVHHTG